MSPHFRKQRPFRVAGRISIGDRNVSMMHFLFFYHSQFKHFPGVFENCGVLSSKTRRGSRTISHFLVSPAAPPTRKYACRFRANGKKKIEAFVLFSTASRHIISDNGVQRVASELPLVVGERITQLNVQPVYSTFSNPVQRSYL